MNTVFFAVVGLLSVRSAECATCACATSNVNVRTGAGTHNSRITVLADGNCLRYQDLEIEQGEIWLKVAYQGQDGWVHYDYVILRDCGCPNIVTREEWSARNPTAYRNLRVPVQYVFIHHSATDPCFTRFSCINKVQSYQNYHMDNRDWSDIGYNFLVGEDGNVYEGRGWNTVGAHTSGHNHDGLGICIIGDFSEREPNAAAVNAVKQLIECGVHNGKLSSGYTLLGHRDSSITSCPGNSLYNLIKTWSHYNY